MKHQLNRIFRLLLLGEWPFVFEGMPFVRTSLSWRGRVNLLTHRISSSLRYPLVFGLPTTIDIEPSSICNLSCPLCPSGLKQTVRHPPLLDLDVFKRLIDQLEETLCLIQLWEWGEPFLNPAIYEMITYAKSKGIFVVTSTNGHFFSDWPNAQATVKSGLDCLIYCIDGTTQETYEKYRAGGRLQEALDGLSRVVSAKKAAGSSSPFINLRMVVNSFNEHQIEDFRALGSKLGVNLTSLKTLNPGMCEVKKDFTFVPLNKQLRRNVEEIGAGVYKCMRPWCTPTLFADGSINMCSMDVMGTESLGKFTEDSSFRKLWNSTSYRTFRKNIRKNPDYYPFCQDCCAREPDLKTAYKDAALFG